MPRFTTRDLLIGTSLIAAGLLLEIASINGIPFRLPYVLHSLYVPLVIWITGGAVFGAGVLYPFKMTVLGAIFGAAAQVAIILIACITY